MPATPPSAAELAEIAAAELAAGMTAILTPKPGDLFAVSANGRWDYEQRSARCWAIWDRHADVPFAYAANPNEARRWTFEEDHPLHDHPRPQRKPVRYEIA